MFGFFNLLSLRSGATHVDRNDEDLNQQQSHPLFQDPTTHTNREVNSSYNFGDPYRDQDGKAIRRSISSSSASLSKAIQYSQTYFSANEGNNLTHDDETLSFYSALQEGFSLDNYPPHQITETNSTNLLSNTSHNLFWAESSTECTEFDKLMYPSHFQVYWHEIVYKIKPKITLFSLWFDLEQAFLFKFTLFLSLINCSQASKSYDLESPSNSCSNNNNNSNSNSNNNSNNNNKDEQATTIIQNISGSFKSGELTAVMGPSGAGKTSLLNLLSRRREDGYTGELYVDTKSNKRIKISTIPQSDHLPEYLTVRENLIFASRLKNTHLDKSDHDKNVENVSKLLGLDDCLDTRTKRISGGQHKRLAIAQELLSKPDILILDEPTSGLDSLTCYRTLSVLKNLSENSKDPIAIVVTIHQPHQEVFDLFDRIYVLANNGLAIYNGPPENCMDFVEKHTDVKRPEIDYNPASFMIEIASGEHGLKPIKALENQVRIEFSKDRVKPSMPRTTSNSKSIFVTSNKQFKESEFNREKFSEIKDDSNSEKNNQEKKYSNKASGNAKLASTTSSGLFIDQRLAKGYSINKGKFFSKTKILIERCWISMLRDPKQMIGRVLFHIILPIAMAIIMGTEPGHANACPNFNPEYRLKDLIDNSGYTSKNVQEEMFLTLENIATIFILMYALTSANIAATTLSFTLDMTSSLKEFYNGWYTMPSYMLARFISDIPMEIILPLITISLSYPLTGQVTGHGLSDAYRILLTGGAVILGSMVGQTMGMIFGAIYIGHVSTALFASQAATLPMVFLSGFVVRTRNMSKFVYALSKFSLYKHALEVSTIARYGYNVCNCKPEIVNGQDAKIVGIPERFNSLVNYFMSAFAMNNEEQAESTVSSSTINATITTIATNDDSQKDLFQLFAKQISLYNTYGIDVKSCKDVIPYQLYDLSLTEQDIPKAFLALIALLLLMKFLLIFTVKLVINFRRSL